VLSLCLLLLAATTATVPFGTPVDVRLARNPEALQVGAVVGDFLVVAPPRPAPGGGTLVTVRPLALGTLPVPFPGEPQPGVVEVQATLAPGAAPAPPRLPAPPPLPWWPAVVLVIAAIAVALLWRRRSPKVDAPLVALQRALVPLTEPSAWTSPHAADVLARESRRFLAFVLAAPYRAMTTQEATDALCGKLRSPAGPPFRAALSLADSVRFAGVTVSAEEGTVAVREVLAAAQVLTMAGVKDG
jgi:hypothetical protein